MPDSFALSLPCSTDFFDASTWTSRAPASLSSKRADAGVAEQVEHVGVRGALAHPVPLRRHVGKEAEMAERRQRGVRSGRRRAPAPIACGTGAMLDPAPAAFLVGPGNEGRVGVPIVARRRPHRLRLGPDDRELAVALELLAVAAVDQAPVGPRLGNDRREIAHAARTAGTPIVAVARAPESIFAPTARTSSRVTAASCSTTSAGSTSRP